MIGRGSGLSKKKKVTAYTAVHRLFSRGGDNQSEDASSDDDVDDRDVDISENDSLDSVRTHGNFSCVKLNFAQKAVPLPDVLVP
jgi:hypothetical protein